MRDRILKRVAPVCSVVAVLAVFASVLGGPFLRDRAEKRQAAQSAASAHESEIEPVATLEPMQRLGPALRGVGIARMRLLKRAAQERRDIEDLQAASRSYRSAIIELRGRIEELNEEIGPEATQRLLGMMMMYYTSVSQRMVVAEIFGDMEPSETEKSSSDDVRPSEANTFKLSRPCTYSPRRI